MSAPSLLLPVAVKWLWSHTAWPGPPVLVASGDLCDFWNLLVFVWKMYMNYQYK